MVVLRRHVHDKVGPVAGGVTFVGVGVSERVVWARLDAILPVETGGGIGCAAGREVSTCEGGAGWKGKSLQGKHPVHFLKPLPVAVAGTEHGCVVCAGTSAILKEKEDGQENTGNECVVHSKSGLVWKDRNGQAKNSK